MTAGPPSVDPRDAAQGSPAERRPTGPTRREVVAGVRRELELAGLQAADVEAERLVAAALAVPRGELGLGGAERVGPAEAADVARAVGRRLEGQPLQHIEGTVDFRRVRLVSDGRALIPRPETEQLIDHIAAWHLGRGGPVVALDIGAGSGAIGIALLDEGIASRVVGLDSSPAALDQARTNVRRTGAAALDLRPCPPSIWPALRPDERFDLIVSNPPYVTTAEWSVLDPAIRDHEPRIALDGGADGLDAIRAIVAGAADRLTAGGGLFVEIGSSQGPAVLQLLRAAPGLASPRIEADLAGHPRFAIAYRAGEPTVGPAERPDGPVR